MGAEKGDTVQVHYTGRLDDGTVFDTSEGRDPLEFTLGAGQVIAGFDAAVRGMEAGEEKTFTIPAAEAYGLHREELLLRVPRGRLPEGLDPEVGQHLHMQTPDGQVVEVVVTEVTDEELVIDANHPLAGRDLTFEVKLLSVR